MGGRCGLKKKMYEEMVIQIMWKNVVEETRWSNCVEKLGGRIFWKNLVVILCGKIGWKPCFKCFVFFYAANLEEQFGGKIYGQNVLERLG